MPDRVVRFTEAFFDRLDQLLPDERAADGTPSVTDFLLFDIPPVRDNLATNYEAATLPADDPVVRVYVGSGLLIARFALFTILIGDAVDVIWIEIEPTAQP